MRFARATAVAVTLATLISVSATAATPRGGAWSGKTEQSRPISFKVTPGGRKLKQLSVEFKARCDDGSMITGATVFTGTFKIARGRFVASVGNTTVTGAFTTKRRASGNLRWTGSAVDPVSGTQSSCSSGKVRWSASRTAG